MSALPQPPRTSRPPRKPAPGWMWPLAWVLSTLLVAGLVAFTISRPQPTPIVVQPPPTPLPTPAPSPITVYVSGAVQNPGLYALPSGARIRDAIEQAGGSVPEAAMESLNLAEVLADGVRIHIPTAAEVSTKATGVEPVPTGISGDAGRATTLQLQVAPGTGGIDINSASQAELEELPGIGPSKAQAIIAHRPYDSVDDLERVPGIGPQTLEDLHPLVVVTNP